MRIFIHRSGQTLGPYSLEQARQEIAAGEISLSDAASYDGYDGNKVPLLKVPGLVPAPKRKFRMGCCGWIILAIVFTAIVMGLESLIDENKVSVNNGVAGIDINEDEYMTGNLGDYAMYRDLIIQRVAGTVWEEARNRPEVSKIVVHLNAKIPERDHKDLYGNETHSEGHWEHLCDIDIDDLAAVRQYQDDESYSLHDEDVVRSYRQQIEPSFKEFYTRVYQSAY